MTLGTIKDHEKSIFSVDSEMRIVVFMDDRLSILSLATHTQGTVVYVHVYMLSVMVLLDHHPDKPQDLSQIRQRQ